MVYEGLSMVSSYFRFGPVLIWPGLLHKGSSIFISTLPKLLLDISNLSKSAKDE